jgi:hypothetical protein
MTTLSMPLLAVLAVAGCGGGSSSDAKLEVECGASWVTSPATPGTCDLACEEMTTGSGPTCQTGVNAGAGIVCASTFEVDGDRGCCFDLGMVGRVVAPNEPKRDRRVFFLSCID